MSSPKVGLVLLVGLCMLFGAFGSIASMGAVPSSAHAAPTGSSAGSHHERPGAASTGGAALLTAAQRSLSHPSSPFAPVRSTGATTFGWSDVSSLSGTAPPYRDYGRMMAYDPVDHYVVLFGGDELSGYASDTWTFANGTWTQLHPSQHPDDRDHGTLAWDAADGYMLLFGGSGNLGTDTDTWTFLHGNWTQLSPAKHPSGRWASHMVYDASDGYVLLFGGCAGYGVNDTWTYLNDTWTQLHPTVSPPDTQDGSMSYDPALGEVILYGGSIDWGASLTNATWAYHVGEWSKLSTPLAPPAREEASMAWDGLGQRLVLFGGVDANGTSLSDTWYFQGGAWSPASPPLSPGGRYFGEMSNSSADGPLVLFSGTGSCGLCDDTWVFYGLNATLSASTAHGDAPLTVNLSATTAGGTGNATFAWQFGDGANAVNATLNYTYSAAGAYLVVVTATDPEGLVATSDLVISVASTFSASGFVSATSGIAPLPLGYAALPSGGTPPYVASWRLNGTALSAASNGTITLAPGLYTFGLTESDSVGTVAHWSTEVTVVPPAVAPLVASATGFPLLGDAPLTVNFSGSAYGGTGALAFAWNFQDGGTATTLAAPHTFAAPGNYGVVLTVTDAKGATTIAEVNVTVVPAPTVKISSATGATAGTVIPWLAQVDGGLGPFLFTWNFGDGTTGTGAITNHTFALGGTYTVSVEVYDATGAHASTSARVTVAAENPSSHSGSNGTGAPSGGPTAAMWAIVGAEAVVGVIGCVAVASYLLRRKR